MSVAAAIRPASKSKLTTSSLGRLASALRRLRLEDDYNPFRFQMHPGDPPINLPGGRTGDEILCDLICRRMWVLGLEDSDRAGRIELDRWGLFIAASNVSGQVESIPTSALLRALAAASAFFGLEDRYEA